MRRLIIIALMLLSAFIFSGCGGGVGAPGSSGSDNTGIVIQSATLTIGSPDIDVCGGRESATLNVSAAPLVSGSTDDPFNGASIEECTITYKKANEDPGAPIIETLTIFPNCPLVNGSTSCDVTLIDEQRKVKWLNDVNGGVFIPAENPTHYVAAYNCRYMSSFGKTGGFHAEVDIWLANFTNCQ